MTIQKKSLISTLKTTKKANVAKEEIVNTGSAGTAVKSPNKLLAAKAAGKAFSAARTAGKRW
jgi:hypothetical protein